MHLPGLEIRDEHIEIPRLFRNLEGELFDRCMICEKQLIFEGLLAGAEQYLVERAFVGDEPIYEFAVCLKCLRGLQGELSRESAMRIEAHFDERVDMVDRRATLLNQSRDDFEPWVDSCLLTKKKRSEARSYAVYAHCLDRRLLFAYAPYMISDEGMEGMMRLLSKKSRDMLEDFTDKYLGMPPEFQDLPNAPALLF